MTDNSSFERVEEFRYFGTILTNQNSIREELRAPISVAARSKAWGLRPLACWDCGFESRRRHGCLSVLSGRGLCDGLITRPEESYRLWCVVMCDLETSRMRRPRPAVGRNGTGEKIKSTLKSANACNHSVQIFFSSSLLSKKYKE